ncbi:2TM domain-containing protein [Pseudotamlana agarivorans]|uniref:2TM domain-containing protein n=1 Tax=Pseudotamlana agarivorans TaxID=481183 RepID=UPI00082D48B3|nr:2TM domain-containing protein [Tamlana agarivorans]
MKPEDKNELLLFEAKKKLRNLKIFYIHLVGYFVVVALLSYNLYIMSGPYKPFFQWFDICILVAWTAFIVIHGWNVFRGKIFFKKDWESKKIREFMETDNQIKRWE